MLRTRAAQGEYRPGITPPPESMLMTVSRAIDAVAQPKEIVLGEHAWAALHRENRTPDGIISHGRWRFIYGIPVRFTGKNDYEVTVHA